MRKTAKSDTAQDKKKLVRYDGGVTKGESAHPRYSFVVRWPGEGGKRLVKWFTNNTQATEWALKKSAEAGELGQAFGSISENERGAVAAWRKLYAKHSNPSPPSLLEIIREFSTRWESARSGATVAASVPDFVAAKKAEGRSKTHLGTVAARLKKFVEAHGERVLPSLATSEISDYLLSLRGDVAIAPVDPAKVAISGRKRKDPLPAKRTRALLSLESRAGHRATLHSFFEWAVGRDLVPSNPVTKAAKPTPQPKLPGILHPADAKAFFAAIGEHAPAIVPFWAVRAFAGLRESEAVAATWHMVDLKGAKITLPATITKTRKPRIVTIQPALNEFLTLHAKKSGPLCPLSPMARRWHLKLAMRHLPTLKLPRNWARHSFATFHLEEFQDPGKTTMQLGHRGGPELLHLRYAGAATEAEAHDFWAIRPATAPDNVVDMTGAPEETQETKPKAQKQKAAR